MQIQKELLLLPDPLSIIEGLTKIDNDIYIKILWINIAKHGGSKKFHLGVIMLIQTEIHDFASGMPAKMNNILQGFVPDIIKVLVPETSSQRIVLDDWEAILKSAQ